MTKGQVQQLLLFQKCPEILRRQGKEGSSPQGSLINSKLHGVKHLCISIPTNIRYSCLFPHTLSDVLSTLIPTIYNMYII